MNKKAQIFGEPFIFIFAIIVAAMVLIFGIKIYYDLSERADFAQVADIAQRINENIITFYNLEEGSSNTFKYVFPNTVECFCFIQDPNYPSTDSTPLSLSLSGNCGLDNFPQTINNEVDNGNKLFWKYSEKRKKGENPANLPYQYKIRSRFITKDSSSAPPTGENPLCFDLVADKHILKVKIRSLGDKVLVDKA
ncbi:hypothetical protein HYV88_00025 [Candidatus Woesearchaeota archaeon]|nr:hypothetical protein [Candidatus Woesearchaeota archaeon]